MNKALDSLRWVAYEEFVSCAKDDSDDDEAKANDITDSTETDIKTEELDSDEEDSESADLGGEG